MSTSNDLFLETFQTALGRLLHLSMRSFWQFAKSQGLSMTQMIALRHLHYRQKCNISDISEELGVSNPASSQLLDRLVRQGLISRSENPQDRRNKQIGLTESGKQILRESALARQSWVNALRERLTPEEARKITEALQILIDKTADIV